MLHLFQHAENVFTLLERVRVAKAARKAFTTTVVRKDVESGAIQCIEMVAPHAHAEAASREHGETHYAYEDEDQRVMPTARRQAPSRQTSSYSGKAYNSIDNIAEFFASREKKFSRPRLDVAAAAGKKGFRPGQRVRHPKYGEGTVYQREGEGEDAKITVQFPRFGLKKLVEKYAQLEAV